MEENRKVRNSWSMFKENNPTAHIFVLILAVNVVFILLSTLIISILPENQGRTVPETIRLAFTLMVNPSGKYIYSESPISLILTTVVVLLGMISLTGGTVGFVTSIINSILEKSARNKKALNLKDHIVILNFNQRVPATLCDYCFDDVASTYIVILTEDDRDTVTQTINEMYKRAGMKKKFKHLIVRTGNPMSTLELDRIALGQAKTVLLVSPEDNDTEESKFYVSKLFLLVNSYLKNSKTPSSTGIVLETADADMDQMIKNLHAQDNERAMVSIQHEMIIGKILGITSIMPSINDALSQLFSFEGTEIYTNPIPKESIIDEISRSRSVMAILDCDGKRAYIAEDESEFAKTIDKEYQLKKALPKKAIVPNIGFAKNEVVIVGINSKLPYILESIDCFREKYDAKDMHVILADTAENVDRLNAYYADPNYSRILCPDRYRPIIINNIYRPMDELSSVVNTSADTVLFLSDEAVSDKCIDEKPLLYWSDINGRKSDKANPDIVTELRNPENISIIESRNKDQILVSNDFLGHLYAQMGKNPLRLGIVMDMITSDGDSSSVNEVNQQTSSGDLLSVNAVRLLGDCDLTFESKRELILWVNKATNGKILPVGIARNGKAYMFSRTEGPDDGLDSCVLLGMHDGDCYEENAKSITLKGDDELIVFAYQ